MILKSIIISKLFFFLNLDIWVCIVAWSIISAVANFIRDMRKCLYSHLGIWLVFWSLTNIGVIELFLPHPSKEKAVVDLYFINLGDDPSLICTLVIHTSTKRYFTLSVILWRYTELCGLFPSTYSRKKCAKTSVNQLSTKAPFIPFAFFDVSSCFNTKPFYF